MLDTQLGALLEEIATEMAFLTPGRSQAWEPMALALDKLIQAPGTQNQADVQQELAWSRSLCQQAMDSDKGLSQEQLNSLQASYERMSSALYLAKPFAPAATDVLNVAEVELSEAEGFTLGSDDDLELLNEFCNEGRELLHQVEQGVLVLEENPSHKDTLNQVFRAFHTFKGGAGFLGIDPIKNLAHQLESVLDAARREQLVITREVIEIILAGGDALQQYVNAIARQLSGEGRGQVIAVPTAALLERAQACLDGEAPPDLPRAAGLETKPVDPDTAAAEPDTVIAAMVASAAPQLAPPVSVPASKALQPAAAAAPQQAPPKANKNGTRAEALAHYVKLDTGKLDEVKYPGPMGSFG